MGTTEYISVALSALTVSVGSLVLFILSTLRDDVREIRSDIDETEKQRNENHLENQKAIASIRAHLKLID